MVTKSKIHLNLPIKLTVTLPLAYWLLVTLRCFLSLFQNGYIHPDEYFQSLEVIAGDIFNVETTRAWEFNKTFPLRNIILQRLTVGSSYHFLNAINPYVKYYLNVDLRSPYLVVTIPRILYCLISFVNDYCLYKLCLVYGQNYRSRLLLLASSYVILTYTIHTFSNSLEIALYSILLLLVSKCMLKSDRTIYHNEFLTQKYRNATNTVDRVKIYKLKSTLPEHSLTNCLKISTVVMFGIFNRPTFIAYAIAPVFYWLNRGIGTKFIGFKDFHIRIFSLVAFAIPSLLFLILADSFYYGYLTIAELESLKISLDNFVVTPLNFLKYNTYSENLSEHGVHPRWLHILVNVPLLLNTLGIIAIFQTAMSIYRILAGHHNKLPRIQSIIGLMLFSFITPVCLLSIFPHQEPRFLIPIIIPVIFLYGPYIFPTDQDMATVKNIKKSLFIIWCIFNAFFTLFYGFLHQGGVFYLARSMHSELLTKPKVTSIHLVTSHIYNLPQSLLLMDSTSKLWHDRKTGQKYHVRKQFFLYEYGALHIPNLTQEIIALHKVNEMKQKNDDSFRLYVALPNSLMKEFYEDFERKNATNIRIWEENKFWPHLSTEAFPKFPAPDDFSCLNDFEKLLADLPFTIYLNMFQRTKCFFSQFSLSLVHVHAKHLSTFQV